MSVREQFARYVKGRERDTSMEIDDEPISNYLRNTMLDALQSIDPAASLQSFASIRITGERFRDGFFDIDAADIFNHIDKEIRAAAPAAVADSFRLGFRTVSPGSVILPLEAFDVEQPEDGTLSAPMPAAVERAFIRVMDIHNQLESGANVIGSADSISTALVRRLRMLVDALDQADAGIEIRLSGSTGQRRTSHLTQRGRTNAHHVFERSSAVTQQLVAGYLVTVAVKDEFARIELKHGKSKYEIHQVPTQVAKHLAWEGILRILVRTETVADRFGEHRTVRHEFLEQVEQGALPDVP